MLTDPNSPLLGATTDTAQQSEADRLAEALVGIYGHQGRVLEVFERAIVRVAGCLCGAGGISPPE